MVFRYIRRGREYAKGKFDNHERASRLNEELTRLGAKTWFDQDRLSGDIVDEMCEGIELSKFVIICITELYIDKVRQTERKNDNCKMEFKYAAQHKAGCLIPVVMESSCLNPDGWKGPTGMILGGLLYENLSEESFITLVAQNLMKRFDIQKV